MLSIPRIICSCGNQHVESIYTTFSHLMYVYCDMCNVPGSKLIDFEVDVCGHRATAVIGPGTSFQCAECRGINWEGLDIIELNMHNKINITYMFEYFERELSTCMTLYALPYVRNKLKLMITDHRYNMRAYMENITHKFINAIICGEGEWTIINMVAYDISEDHSYNTLNLINSSCLAQIAAMLKISGIQRVPINYQDINGYDEDVIRGLARIYEAPGLLKFIY